MKTIGSKVVFGDTIRSLTQTESISQLSHRSIKFSSASGLFPSSNESPRVIPIRIFMTDFEFFVKVSAAGANFSGGCAARRKTSSPRRSRRTRRPDNGEGIGSEKNVFHPSRFRVLARGQNSYFFGCGSATLGSSWLQIRHDLLGADFQ